MTTLFFFSLLITGGLVMYFPSLVGAQAVNIRGEFFTHNPGATAFRDGSIGSIISLFLPNVLVIAGVFFVFLVLYGGYQYIIHSGQMDSPQIAQKAQRSITQGAIGLLLVVAAYFILQIISTVTGINFINSPVT